MVGAQRQLAKEFAIAQAQRAQAAEDALKDTAVWLQRAGFPFDFRTPDPPPLPVYRALVSAWAEEDDVLMEEYAGAIADETGWPDLAQIDEGPDNR